MTERAPDRVNLAGLWPRCGATLIDRAPIALLSGLWYWLVYYILPAQMLVLSVLFAVIFAAWVMAQWWAYGTRKAGFGYWVCGLELVGTADGKPIGWWRMFLRTIVFYACWALVLPGIVLVIFLITQEHRQGWHDLAAGSISIQKREIQPQSTRYATMMSPARTNGVAPLPPHLLAPTFEHIETPEPPSSPISYVPGQQPYQHAPHQLAGSPYPASRPYSSYQESVPQQTQYSQQPAQRAQRSVEQPPAWQQTQQASPPQNDQRAEQPAPNTEPPVQASSSAAISRAVPARQPVVRVREHQVERIEGDSFNTLITENPIRATMRRAEGGWYLKFDDGREVDVVSPVLIGRNPAPRPDEVGVALISSGEPSHTISRTHLLIGTDARGIYVTDRGSTNGTGLVLPGGRVEPCQPGAQTHIREGQKIKFGERFLTIERRK